MTSSDTSSTNASAEREWIADAPGRINVSASISGPDHPADSIFKRLCGNCGYQLTGLLQTGICPECGQRYLEDEIVIAGWAAGPHETLSTASPRQLWRVALVSLGYVWIQAIINLTEHRLNWALCWAGGGAAVLAWALWRRGALLHDFGHTAHLRISPYGIGQREGFGPVKPMPWAARLQATLIPQRNGIHLLAVSRVGADKQSKRRANKWPIGFEFECSEKQAAYLRAVLQQWTTSV
jgi:hypothetical protein